MSTTTTRGERCAAAIGRSRQYVNDQIKALVPESSQLKFPAIVSFLDEDWTPPLYNVWYFAKKTNETSHFGNSEQRILENLLYLYTQPF